MRIVVQRTFIEVVAQPSETTVKRAYSAPAGTFPAALAESSRGGKLSSGTQELEEEEAGRPEGLGDAARREHEGLEPRTTVAIRNIPLHLTRDQLVEHLDARGFAGRYDFLYLPTDFAKCRNVGYAFVNLSKPGHAQRIFAEFDGLCWGEAGEGRTIVGWSQTQGLDSLIERYRNSPVMHESMLDECKPIVLEGSVRVEFPPPTKKVQRLRRLRSRCGSRGRGVPLPRVGGALGADAHCVGDAPGALAGSCALLAGLSKAPGGTSQDMETILASPLLAGLKASPAGPSQRREKGARADHLEAETLSECSTTASVSAHRRAAWADLQDGDFDSECSTQALGYFSGALSSDASGRASDGLATRQSVSNSAAQPWSGSMLTQGLMPAVPEEKGSVLAQGLTRDGCRPRRLKATQCGHAGPPRHAEAGQ